MPDLRYGTVAGFAAAAEEAHRRRAAKARATALALAVVVALGGTTSVLGRTDASGRLVPAAPSPASTASRPAPAATRTPGSPSPSVAAPGAGPATGPAGGTGSSGPRQDVARPTPSPTAGPAAARPRGPWSTPISRREASHLVPCLAPDRMGCFEGGAAVVTAQRVGLLAQFCTKTREERVLSFPDDAEVEVWVTPYDDAGTVLWRSLADRPAKPAPHDVTVPASACVEWKTWWLRRTDAGTPIPPGSYTVRFRARSPDVDLPPTEANFTVT
ncbi:MAG TPA: hypothetical protein VGX28_00010 [Frankiaceae bacterium]|jgi:hypothetical protein|nr:hypothetical protein [Frankiaceae bacterium]